MLKRVLKDPVIYFLMSANIVLAYAYFVKIISAETILFTYFFQSLMLGLSYFFQILTIQEFSVDNLKINGKQVEKSTKTKGCISIFFLLHYGFFHLVYLLFLMVAFDFHVNSTYLLATMATFALGELIAVNRHKSYFNSEVPNIGTMMFIPYLRIIPMHLFILIGGFINYDDSKVFSVFIILKIICDITMHIIVNNTWKDRIKNTQPPIINI